MQSSTHISVNGLVQGVEGLPFPFSLSNKASLSSTDEAAVEYEPLVPISKLYWEPEAEVEDDEEEEALSDDAVDRRRESGLRWWS